MGAIEVFDEGVGTESRVLASGPAEVGGFAASERSEALLPTAGVGQRCWNWSTSSQPGALTRPRWAGADDHAQAPAERAR